MRLWLFILLSSLLLSLSNNIQCKEEHISNKATWELGLGIGALNISDYIGSDEERAYVVPLPYFVYNSEAIKADRKGVRGLLWDHADFELDISSKISLPVDSDKNKARQGMPDLDPLFEIGPSLNYNIFTSIDEVNNLSFQFPLRSVLTFDDWKFTPQGWVINPSIDYNYQGNEWKLGFKLGAILANAEYNQYFYAVKQEFITDTRSFYEAKSGVVAYKLTTTISRRFNNWYLGAFIDYNDLNDAKNNTSPLVKSKTNVNLGFFFARVFKQNRI